MLYNQEIYFLGAVLGVVWFIEGLKTNLNKKERKKETNKQTNKKQEAKRNL